MDKQRKTISVTNPSFTALQPMLFLHTCACGSSAGIDGYCSECRDRKFTSLDGDSVGLGFSQHYPSFVQQESHLVEQTIIPGSCVSGRPSFGHNFSNLQVHAAVPETIQTKLTVNQPGDQYEQEADQVAEQVMRMSETGSEQRGLFRRSPEVFVSKGFLLKRMKYAGSLKRKKRR